jgi:hypothetical protein
VSIQVAILKVLASHGSGKASLASLNKDIAILSTSGPEWSARLRQLASRVQKIDIFGAGYVVRDDEGWEITVEGRAFLSSLEAITQDNLQLAFDEADPPEVADVERGDLIVVGHRFRNRVHRPGASARKRGAAAGSEYGRRGENASS